MLAATALLWPLAVLRLVVPGLTAKLALRSAALVGSGLVLAVTLSERMTGVAQPPSVALAAIGRATVPLVELLLWKALQRHPRVR